MTINFEDFKNQAAKILNINLSGYKIKRVQRRTDSLMKRHNIESYEDCIKLLKTDKEFKASYMDHFTINTSEFYRNPKNFEYLKDKIIPNLYKEKKHLKIWSAPCSNGSEPYTLALILTELNYNKRQYELLASDLDINILEEARNAVYNENSIQNVPDDVRDKYFKNVDGPSRKYKLNLEIVKKVKFEKKDLINESFSKGWDLILSRNFFIYLTRDIKDALTLKFAEALNPGGYFFLGNTEFIFNPEQFGLKKIYSSFYQKIK
ncbi:MAG: CheR family methyltransferase [Bacillota bacterium]